MKKAVFILLFIFGSSAPLLSQIDFGLKAGINYNSNSIREVGTDLFDGASSRTGYHAGIWLRFKIPGVGLYLRPELVYTNLENELLFKSASKNTTYNFQKLDIPVLLGKKIFSIGNIYIGPSFQYILNSGFSISEISNANSEGFTVGLQFGGGVELGKFGIDVRWERAFSGIESSFVSTLGLQNFDTRINQIIIGVSYRL